MSNQSLTAELAAALGLPKNTIRAALILDSSDHSPRIELACYVTDSKGVFQIERLNYDENGSIADRIVTVMKKFKLVPIDDQS
mgnify:CR=1 FL=1